MTRPCLLRLLCFDCRLTSLLCRLLLVLSLHAALGEAQVRASPVVTAIRVVNGSSSRDGRVEIEVNAVWGTICQDGWTANDSIVACRMLGFNPPSRAINMSSGLYPPGPASSPVHARAVQCYGSELTLTNCPAQWTNITCTHNEDAGVICLGDVITTTTTTTPRPSTTTLPPTICNITNQVDTLTRLVKWANQTDGVYEGRVQIMYNGVWGGICADQWGLADAQVVCRSRCYNPANARAVIGGQLYGNATEAFLLSRVQCLGSESSVRSCPNLQYNVTTSCDYSQPAAVSCVQDAPTLPPLPTAVISCANESITAVFSKTNDPLLHQQHLSVAASTGLPLNCSAATAENSTHASITIPFISNCNTTRQTNASHVVYNSTVRYAVPSSSDTITRTEVYYIPVLCIVPRASDPDNAFNTSGRTVPPQPGDGKYDIRLMFFENSLFQRPIGAGSNSPLEVTLGDWLYVGAQLYSTDRDMKLVLSDCYVSPAIDTAITPHYDLIKTKCAVESSVTLYPVNDTLSGFRFQSFQFINRSSALYLHCSTFVCGLWETTGNCDPTCRGRSARDVIAIRIVGIQYDISSAAFVIAQENPDTGVIVTSSSSSTSRSTSSRDVLPTQPTQPAAVADSPSVESDSILQLPSHVLVVTCVVTSLWSLQLMTSLQNLR